MSIMSVPCMSYVSSIPTVLLQCVCVSTSFCVCSTCV